MITQVVNSNNFVLYEFNSKTHKGLFNGNPPICTSFIAGRTYVPKGEIQPVTITYNPDAENHDEFNDLFITYIRDFYKGKDLKVKYSTDHSNAILT